VVDTFVRRGAGLEEAFRTASMLEASERLPQGLYTTLRTYGGRGILRPEAHAERLSHRGSPIGPSEVLALLGLALDRTAYAETRARLTYAPPDLFVSVEPFIPLPAALFLSGVSCATVGLAREDPGAKSTAFIGAAARAYSALPEGIHEGLMVAPDGAILEGLSSNAFFVSEGCLRTEGARVLPGVTRSLVLEIASGVLPVREEALRVADLGRAQEAFLSSVSRGILPVVRIDGAPIGGGSPGPITKTLAAKLESLASREAVRA
jgi:branched-subunit amino acid aminotransferase/4-amino-4-deoxychorismate lyase